MPDTTHHKELTSRGLKSLEFAALHVTPMKTEPKALVAMLLEIAHWGDYPEPPDLFTRAFCQRSLEDGSTGDSRELINDAELLGADVAKGWVLTHFSDDRAF